MPKQLDETQISRMTIVTLLTQCNDEISETLVSTVSNIKKWITRSNEYFELGICTGHSDCVTALTKAFTDLPNVTDHLNVALQLFSGGEAVAFYNNSKIILQRYSSLFQGAEVSLEKVEACMNTLRDLETTITALSLICNHEVDTLHGSIMKVDANKIQQTILQSHVLSLQKNHADLHDCLQNYIIAITEISDRLYRMLASLIVISVNKAGLDFEQDFDAESFFAKLSTYPEIIRPLKLLNSDLDNVSDILFKTMQKFKDHAATCAVIDDFHPGVKRTHYLGQILSLAAEINTGYCSGGIRYWSSIQSLPSAREKYKYHFELNESEPELSLLSFQSNSDSYVQKYKSSNHFYHKILSKKVGRSSAAIDDDNDQHFIAQHINDIMTKLTELATLYNYNATFELDLFFGDQPGHAVGFKIIEQNNKVYYFFRDYNNGEFVTDDIAAFKIWLEKFFVLYTYAANLSDYDLYVIRNKNHPANHPVKQAFAGFAQQALAAAPSDHNSVITTPLQKAFATFQKSSDSIELGDNLLRQQINKLIPEFDEDAKFDYCLKTYYNLYNKISIKNASDLIFTFILKLNSIELLSWNSREEVLLQFQEAENIAKSLVNQDSEAASIYRRLWIQSARFHLEGYTTKQVAQSDTVVELLDHFYRSCCKIKVDELFCIEGFQELQQLNKKLQHLLSEKPIRIQPLTELVTSLDELLSENYPLWMMESLITVYMNKLACDVKSEIAATTVMR